MKDLPKETGCGGRIGLGVWDGNVVKSGCDDGCTTINIIKFIVFFKKIEGQSSRMNRKLTKNKP